MNELEELKQKHIQYVKEQADKIVLEMIRRGVTTDTLATCDYSNWDRELHSSMLDIAKELKKRSVTTKSSVNHGVTDWIFTIEI